MRIECVDLPGPAVDCIATDHGLVPFGERGAAALAADAMLLAMSPDHAERLLASASNAADTTPPKAA